MVSSNVLQPQCIKVDVGGSLFHVSRSILTAEPNSVLDPLFSGRFRVNTQADNLIFIDRCVWRVHVFTSLNIHSLSR